MTRAEYKKYLEDHYPRVYPCMKCYYWRGQSGSHTACPMLPLCHYMLDTEEKRESYPDFEKGYCKEFKARSKK